MNSKKTTTTTVIPAPLAQKKTIQKTITLPSKLYNFAMEQEKERAELRGRDPNFSEYLSDLIFDAKSRLEALNSQALNLQKEAA